jgi:hypothetical protein
VWFLFLQIYYLKTMRKIKYSVTILMITAALISCVKIQQLSPIPRIEFTSFAIFDTTDILGNSAKGGRLKFYFEDGDGDLGLNPPSIVTADTTNLFLTLFRKADGIMVQAADNDPLKPSAYRIPYMERQGQNKLLKGTISITFLYLFYAQGDTIKYDFYVKDRNLNQSNVASTSEIVISENKVYTK